MAKTEQTGLYDATNEHDACGVGMVVNIHGNKSHELVDSALKVLENMRHRGAEGADNKTGDGAGIMLQIPHEFILLPGQGRTGHRTGHQTGIHHRSDRCGQPGTHPLHHPQEDRKARAAHGLLHRFAIGKKHYI